MEKTILKFNDLIKTIQIFEDIPVGKLIVSLSNIDCIFAVLRKKGIYEIKVDWEIMLLIARVILANISYWKDNIDIIKENSEYPYSDSDWDVLKIIREGRVDKFLGVKLYLEDN